MKRRKTKITNIETIQSGEFEELFDESAEITIRKHISKETEEFLQKYDYIISDDRLSLDACGTMMTILSFPKDTILTASLLKTTTSDSKAEIQSSLEELVSVGYIKQVVSLTEEQAYICNIN